MPRPSSRSRTGCTPKPSDCPPTGREGGVRPGAARCLPDLPPAASAGAIRRHAVPIVGARALRQPREAPSMNAFNSAPEERSTAMAGEKLSGRVALVTGGSRGIGAAICRSLASQGASVAAGYNSDRERAEQFLKEFDQHFSGEGRATVHQGNVSKPEDCRRVVQEVLDQHGRLDILVNNAGITIDKMAMKMSVA